MPFLTSVRPSVVRGMQVGVLAGALIAVVDCIDTMTGHYTGSRWLLAPYLLAFEVLVLGVLAGLLSFWVSSSCTLTPSSSKRAGWLRPLLMGLPWAVAFALIPTGWIAGRWLTLPVLGKALAIGVCCALFSGTVVIAWLLQRLLPTARESGRWKLLAAGAFVLAALCYWMDRSLYVGLYETFHLGLALLVVNAVLLGTLVLHLRFVSSAALRWGRPAAALGLALGVVVAAELARPHIFGPSRSLIFAKAVNIGRALTDFDADGASGVIGGSDCAAFDASVGPGAFDLPGNPFDEDCTGTAAAWPAAPSGQGYPKVDRRGSNLLILSIDALRADHLGAYGYARNTSPNIDKLAAESQRFINAFAHSTKTMESLPSLLSGLYPANISRNYDDSAVFEFAVKKAVNKGNRRPKQGETLWYRANDDMELLAETLRDSGYATAAVTAAFPLDLFGLAQGLQRFEMEKEATRLGQEYLREMRATGQPFFLWIHYNSPHEPYVKHEQFPFGDRPIDRYDSEIAYDDAQVGLMLQTLRDEGVYDSTIAVITSDHGEEFGDHGGRSHGTKLHRELLNVPLLIKIPGVEPKVMSTPVELADLVPTFCELLQLKQSCQNYDGQSLLAAIADQRDPERGAYAELYKGVGKPLRRSLRDSRWRLIDDLEYDRRELYDLDADPNEHYDVSAQHPQTVLDLLDRIAARPRLRQIEALRAANTGSL